MNFVRVAVATAACASACRALSPVVGKNSGGRVPQRVSIESSGWHLIADYTAPDVSGASHAGVIMLNQANGNRRAYESLARDLAHRGIASLRVDLRGHGESTNRGRFIPFDTTGTSISLDSTLFDVEETRKWLARQVGIDSSRIAIVGASYSAEAMMQSARRFKSVCAYIALSPGNLSDSSLAGIDRGGSEWLIVVSEREQFVRRQQFIPRVLAATHRSQLIVVSDSAHATDLLATSTGLSARVADWIVASLKPAQ